jgi:AraC family transcriptional regulator, regulatory protein of adaptative response / methylated-DNA-[protein]-cysteine methyltransferase
MENAMDASRLWTAFEARDAAADGRFVVAVTSTGIYCKPSCPARRPKRENVRFYPVPEAAEQAGYRACKRCRPDRAEAADPRLAAIRKAARLIEAAEAIPTLPALGRAVGLSPHHLQRLFTEIVGVSPRAYGEARRVARLKADLKRGEPVAQAMYGAGYGSASRLYEKARAELGMTPARYRKGGVGEAVRFAIRKSPLDLLLVAATERGVCMIALGDDEGRLARALAVEFPGAALARDEAGLGAYVEPIVRHLSGKLPHLALPLDVRATAFQRRVWQELQRIPAGRTASYRDVARRIGKPKAVRAVANACASNPVPLVVPCHRVVGADGALGGYRWGEKRKAALLARERREAGDD